jgi:hypothetical protein
MVYAFEDGDAGRFQEIAIRYGVSYVLLDAPGDVVRRLPRDASLVSWHGGVSLYAVDARAAQRRP